MTSPFVTPSPTSDTIYMEPTTEKHSVHITAQCIETYALQPFR